MCEVLHDVGSIKLAGNARIAAAALIGVVLVAAIGWAAARQIRSPAQVASDTAPPAASLITAPVELRALATEVIVRGTVRYGKPQEVALPVSGLKNNAQIVSRAPRPDSRLRDGAVGLTVSGRPVFVLRGETPMHRDLGPGDSGEDVRQLERGLARLGHLPGPVDGRYDGATGAAVAALYRSHDAAPFGLTEAQAERLSAAASAVATATDALLQMRVALRGASAEVNQAQLDAAAVAESIPAARAAVVGARTRIAEARDLLAIAQRQERRGDATARRELAAAQVEVTAKQNALNEATGARDDAQRDVNTLPPDAEAERAAASTALRAALAAMASARADLTAAEQARAAAQEVLDESVRKARDDGRKAQRDLALARADAAENTRTVSALVGKYRLARERVAILLGRGTAPRAENDAVAAAIAELRRVQGEYTRIASRSGVQVPADEILFFAQTPVRVDSVAARAGTPLSGALMTVSNTRLAIDSSLSPQEKDLVRRGDRVRIEEQDLRIAIGGRVAQVADKPGTNPDFDPGRTYFEVTPFNAPAALVGASVKLSISVQSTDGEVLAVPVNALSVGADGRERVQVDRGTEPELVYVRTGLRAQGFVEVSPRTAGALKEGDRVVIGSGGGAAAAKAANGSAIPVTPAGASTTPSAASGGGAAAGAGAGAPATSGPTTTTTTEPPAPPAPREPDATPTGGAQGTFRGP